MEKDIKGILLSALEQAPDNKQEIDDNQKNVEIAKEVTSDDLNLPSFKEKQDKQKQSRDESAAILRKQRDEYKQKVEELEAKVSDATSGTALISEVKKLINKDDLTEDDLKQMIKDYDFTKKEAETLRESYAKAQAKIKEYDIYGSDEFIENYAKPVQIAGEALGAEIMLIQGDEYIPVPEKARDVFNEMIDSGDVSPTKVKIALAKIKKAYEDEDYEYEMPNIRNVTNNLLDIVKAAKKRDEAVENWESDKLSREKEGKENEQFRQTTLKVKTREERKIVAQGYLDKLVKSDEFDILSDFHGASEVTQMVNKAHNELTTAFEDVNLIPTYQDIIEWRTMAMLYRSELEERKREHKLAVSKKKSADLNNIGSAPDKSATGLESENAKLLAKSIGQ